MPQAARLADLTAHGTPLGPGPGSSDVLIGGRPAWRAGTDFHSCPLASGVEPHVGGIVPMGSTSVLVNDAPAARMGDVVVEATAPNVVASGCPTVLID